MQVDNNLNSMMQLGNRLDKSAHELNKLNTSAANSAHTQQENKKESKAQEEQKNIPMPDLTKEMLEQIQIPIAYTANAEVIKVQDTTTQTLLDIKA